ncbi:MAG: ABC transporter ATP-binding protein [Firmicutes bacterium]|nr:ABC transporter ATP-binding protein [Bacillota bacterium]
MKKENSAGSVILRKVLKVIGNYKLLLAASIVLAAVSVVIQLYVPILFGDAIDQIIDTGRVDFNGVAYYLSRILILILISGIASWIMNLINNRMAYKVVEEIRSKAIRHIQVLPLSYLDRHSTGDIVSRVIADADQLSDGLLLGFTQLFSGVITILVTLGFMLSKNLLVTGLVILLTPLSFFVARFIASRTYKMFRKQAETRDAQTALIEEMVGGSRVVKAFGYEKTASRRFAELNKVLRDYSQRAVFYSSITNPSTRFVNNVIYAAVALAGALLIINGQLTVGGLSVLLNYSNQYMKPFNDISSVVAELQNALACASRIFELIETDPEKDAVSIGDGTDDTPSAEVIPAAEGYVDIDDVFFSYRKDRQLIENYTLHAKPGMRIAIVGPTGCGKTTMINLLMRFYDADSGSIKVDGRNIYEMSRHELRAQYGMVLQDTWLSNTTVRDNIRFGKPDATEDEIIKAAREAHSWEFIRRLPQGLDTVLTEDSLSQGQKQLLCITRVMLCLPPMLILDEATSSIDTRTELQIQEAFDKLMEGRTSFIVAHRLSTIRSADVILVMKDGHIIEQGSHNELMEQDGFYKHLYNSQFANTV